jgi:quercetin dioxygenase-like cupin family protein
MSVDLDILGPVGIRQFDLAEVCHESQGHEHNYDHVTVVTRGRLRVTYSWEEGGQTVTGQSREFAAGERLLIKAKVRHTIKAMEPNTQYLCVFSHRDFDGLVTQVYQGNAEAYQ